jgi:hypothetical protein
MEAPLAATRDTAARTAVLRCFIDLRQDKKVEYSDGG